MKNTLRAIAFILLLTVAFSLLLTSCQTPDEGREQTTEEERWQIPEEEYTLPLEDGYNQLTLYWNHKGTYENCDVWIWWGDKAGQGHLFHECAYGAKMVVNVPVGVEEVGFIVRKDCSDPGGSSWGSATKDYEQDRFAIIEGRETVIYLKSGDAAQ